MTLRLARFTGAALLMAGFAASPAAQQLNVVCNVQGEWCTLAAIEFEKETGIKATMVQKGSGESFAQISAEKANPEARPLVRRHRRPAPAGGGAGIARGIQVAAARATAAVGAEAGRAIEVSHGRPVSWRARHRLQHRASRAEEARRADLLEGSRQAGIRGRSADGEPERLGHRVHGDRDVVQVFGEDEAFKYLARCTRTSTPIRARASRRSRPPRAAKRSPASRSSTTSSPRRRPAFR